MGSADFSQFVVTTANETACETSTLKVHALSPHLPATFTGTSSNFWTSSLLADLSVFPSLICGSCPSGQGFAYSFLQIPPHDGHPCCSAMYFVVAYAYSGLSPVRARPWRANQRHGPLHTAEGRVSFPFRSALPRIFHAFRTFFAAGSCPPRNQPASPSVIAVITPFESCLKFSMRTLPLRLLTQSFRT